MVARGKWLRSGFPPTPDIDFFASSQNKLYIGCKWWGCSVFGHFFYFSNIYVVCASLLWLPWCPSFLTDDASSVFHRHMLLHKDPSTYDHSSVFYFSSSVPPFGGPWWFFGSWLIQCVLSHFAFTQISCWYHHSSELPFDRYHHHSSHPLFNISFSNFSFSIKSSTHKSAHVYHLRTNYITKICSHWLWQKNGKPDVSIPSSTSTGIISSWTKKVLLLLLLLIKLLQKMRNSLFDKRSSDFLT